MDDNKKKFLYNLEEILKKTVLYIILVGSGIVGLLLSWLITLFLSNDFNILEFLSNMFK